ncbi:DUF6440 family protein [Ileibacterium valens]|uniref:Xylan 1,4-beta-xylosidase n=1 Tax=Ileibacterium valens TaxID=1862668 RepID=A0A1U7NHB1_9FIRM|nr:DUF6440 family protein [Ileibacterium valens]OLU36239.1 xylan 1,4-beta-xylosidase [Erysipelotrichaceae bacterium NYU-BL-E8]OLU37171.1 xylan 1,4-beta-xylosidase [Erysipelotrichaceae bacterium NYU-BL-F16]OLU41035.1 xylan 1,4-beta-xylosidase [Ileibacterium valens]
MSKNEHFVEVYSQGMVNLVRILVDTETGVNYLVCTNSGSGTGMTVLLDREGNPVISPLPIQSMWK